MAFSFESRMTPRLEYKCRRCGAIYEVKDDSLDCTYIANLVRLGGGSVDPHLVSSHRCDSTHRGVTDLIGCTYVENAK